MRIKDKVISIVAEQLGLKPDEISLGSTASDLGADRLDEIEIVMELEEQFDIEIEDHEAEKFTDVQSIITFILHQVINEPDDATEELKELRGQIKKVHEGKEPFVIPAPEPYIPPTELSLLARIIVSQTETYYGHGTLSVIYKLSLEEITGLVKELADHYSKINSSCDAEAHIYSDGSGSIYIHDYWSEGEHPVGHRDMLLFSWGEV